MNRFYAVAGAVCVASTILLTCWAAVTLPKGVRIPTSGGWRSWDRYAGRTWGLIVWPFVAVVLYLVGMVLPATGPKAGMWVVLFGLVLWPVFAFQAFRTARRGYPR